MARKLYEIPTEEDRTVILPEDVFLALEGKAAEEAKRIAGAVKAEDHAIARLITPRSLAQKVLRGFAERHCKGHYKPSRDPSVRRGE